MEASPTRPLSAAGRSVVLDVGVRRDMLSVYNDMAAGLGILLSPTRNRRDR